ncbi:class I SAM-dependent methyltransferase [Mesorhizobium sp. M2D.F.Ca.ET.185.01.1.1]|uniref:class I SAM-dependent methyltransferase n=2 Tax=Mesorhizobium TaxID=68287 RepID=UPI000FC9B010|nr:MULTISPECIES: class I SAM-dependent methyltransferase [unclassified Mesorhizobium]TGP52761.1 class I SAM-dependent methyltransferase [bacterium M00.F.Ca.ET.230.01.1.1]TGP80969.1 class I SAM-dependent methyltransferase [bacterium M00.F.Ca.ET.227.01.1.1]TGP90752.1 class I SAM-dependent methyltransferase [bacterium M00.F.Ca.ET.221.01.1.1]TGP97431.1 class I SAM-dependent methyltransferase [bacterium M00.F.Ca.ET.222.01.1.1]TGU07932.1 class I SAM-dependent methyltransferase [bacterium M00.F.Ca.ET
MNFHTADAHRQHVDVALGRRCRLCAAPLHHTFVDLGMSPPCESFIPPDHLGNVEAYYPLHVMVCEECFLVQLPEHITPQEIFTEYAYFSSYSTSWVEHAKRYCEYAAARFGLGEDTLAVELASNDGYLLQHFQPLGVPTLGIEPAVNVAQAAIAKGVPTRIDFFGVRLARELINEGKQADLIVGNNVLAQVPDLNDFVGGIALLLKPQGVVTLEFPHIERLIDENQFDTIYHEHFSYFSLTTIDVMAARHGLKIFDVEELPTHGGSLRVYLARVESVHRPAPAVAGLLEREATGGLTQMKTYTSFAERAYGAKRALLSFLISAKNEGKTICGYGAPGKGNTLLNYCGIGTDFLEFTVDRNPYKHGRFTPGMHIPIRPVEAIEEAKPDYILILPWNLKDEIIRQMSHVAAWGAKFVVPIPFAEVIDPAECLP